MSKEWPALGQEKISRKKFQPRVSSFAAAVKIQSSEPEGSQEQSDKKLGGDGEINLRQQACQSLTWEERNAANRAAKLAQKEEKKIKREENARRQLLAPKGYRLQLIKNNVSKTSAEAKSAPAPNTALLESSFPLLGEVQKNIPRTSIPFLEEPNSTEVVPEHDIANPSKKKRPDKFLSVNLEQLLELSAKNKVVTTKKKKIKIKKVCFEEKLSGNPLDSSQPTRRRGKIREIPKKKKKSSLKISILAYRKLKELQRLDFNKKSSLIEDELEEEPADTCSSKMKINDDSSASAISYEHKQIKDADACTGDTLKFTTLDIIHSRKFREYCDNILSKDLDFCVQAFLKVVVDLQDKSFHRDPIKHKKRIVYGLHEARKTINLKKSRILIIAPDLESCPEPGGLDSKIMDLISLCKDSNTPYAFCIGRRKLGKIFMKKVPVSCASIVNSDGAEVQFKNVLLTLLPLKEAYREATGSKCPNFQEQIGAAEKPNSDVNKFVVSSLLNALEESLHVSPVPEFLKVIESIEAENESD